MLGTFNINYLDAYNFTNQFFMNYTYTVNSADIWFPVINVNFNTLLLASDTFLNLPFNLGAFLLFIIVLYFFSATNYNLYLSSLLSFSEKEINALDDLIVSVFIIFMFFFFNFLGCFGYVWNIGYNTTFILVFATLVLMLVLIPVTMVYNFGFYFIISIRGGATTLSYVYELILDYINIISFTLRLCIQLVRIVVIAVTYYMYNHLFFTYNYYIIDIFSWSAPTSYIMAFSADSLLVQWGRLVFEVGHTFIIFGVQLIAFSVMILWLFQFLFTLFYSQTMETSFFKKI